MKPLLKPRRRPDGLDKTLYSRLDCRYSSVDEAVAHTRIAMTAVARVLEPRLTLVTSTFVEPVGDEINRFNWFRIRRSKEEWIGSLDLSWNAKLANGKFQVFLEFPYDKLDDQWSEAVQLMDAAYQSLHPRTMYVCDSDDWLVQNCTDAGEFSLEMHGISRRQVDIIDDGTLGGTIDTRANPGYTTWWQGYECSIQWLNYWSKEAVAAIFEDFPSRSLKGVDLTLLPDGGTRLRLSEKPGKYNDVKFHELQLRVREWLGWNPSMWKLQPDPSDFR